MLWLLLVVYCWFPEISRQFKNKKKNNNNWNFVKKLALSALLIIPTILFIPVILLTVGLFAAAFALLGRFKKPIDEGTDTLRDMGWGLVLFGAGLLVFTLASLVILKNPATLLVMVGTIILIGGAIALLGMFGKVVDEGSETLAFMGLGLIVFSIGIGLYALVAKMITFPCEIIDLGDVCTQKLLTTST